MRPDAGAGIQLNDRLLSSRRLGRGDNVASWHENEGRSGGAARCVDMLKYFAEREK
jgi:hypothetical protein